MRPRRSIWTDARLDALNDRVGELSRRVDGLSSRIDGFHRAMVQAGIVIAGTMVTGFLALVGLIATRM